MADGGKTEGPQVKLALLLTLLLVLLTGCEGLNDALVRHSYKDSGMSRRARGQIREGLEKRETAPARAPAPPRPAPPFMDEG